MKNEKKKKYRVKVVFKKSRSKTQPFYYVTKSWGNFKILNKSETYTDIRAAERSASLATGGEYRDVLFQYEKGILPSAPYRKSSA